MDSRGLLKKLRHLLKEHFNNRESIADNEHTDASAIYAENNTLEETEYIVHRLKSIPGLWEELRRAISLGKPQCMNQVIGIIGNAGLIKTDPEITAESGQSIEIYSGHHESASQIRLSSEETAILTMVIWSIEGKHFKRQM
jgi:hypothetical protein